MLVESHHHGHENKNKVKAENGKKPRIGKSIKYRPKRHVGVANENNRVTMRMLASPMHKLKALKFQTTRNITSKGG